MRRLKKGAQHQRIPSVIESHALQRLKKGAQSDLKNEKRILFVNCCISVHEKSRTKRLADAFLETLLEHRPEAEVEEINLMQLGLKPLDPDMIRRRNTLSDALVKGAEEFQQAEQFASADLIVIAAPYWEMSFPSLLRIYIEHISALNVTFGYSGEGRQVGLCRAERMVYLTTAGGVVGDRDYGGDYLKGMCEVYGIPEFSSIAAECLDIQGMDAELQLEEAVRRAKALAARI